MTYNHSRTCEEVFAMKMYKLNCPYCKGELLEQDGLETFYCKYCGKKIILTGQNQDILRYKIRERDSERRSREKDEDIRREFQREKNKIEIERAKEREKDKNFIQAMGILLALTAFFGLLLLIIHLVEISQDKKLEVIYSEIQTLIDAGEYDKALDLTEKLKGGSDDRNWDDKRIAFQQKIGQVKIDKMEDKTVRIALSANDFHRMYYKDAVKYFKNAGFIYVNTVETSKAASLHSKGYEVYSVSVDGVDDFKSGTSFPLDARVVITYDKP